MVPNIIVITFLLVVFSSFSNNNVVESSTLKNRPLVPALYVFGDSLVDAGNNNWLNTRAKADYTPYGIDFPNPNPTGRQTNGKTLADLICDYLGLPYAPPFYDPFTPTSWLTGYNYASSSCGIDGMTGIGNCSSLDEQVRNFKKTIKDKFDILSPTQMTQHLSQSIFLFVIGSSDYLVNYFDPRSDASHFFTPEQYANILVGSLTRTLLTLYKLGVRKTVVAEVSAVGCVPHKNGGTKCNEEQNNMASLFNKNLHTMIQNFGSELKDARFTLASIFDLSRDAFYNPRKYGFTITRRACCRVNSETGLCKPTTKGVPAPCPNRKLYYFWDGFHPSQAFNSIIARECINGSFLCRPFNIQQLVHLPINQPQPQPQPHHDHVSLLSYV